MDTLSRKSRIVIIAAAVLLIIGNIVGWSSISSEYRVRYDEELNTRAHDIMSVVVDAATTKLTTKVQAIGLIDIEVAKQTTALEATYAETGIKNAAAAVVKCDYNDDGNLYVYRVVSASEYRGFSKDITAHYRANHNEEKAIPEISLSVDLINLFEKEVKDDEDKSIVIKSFYCKNDIYYPKTVVIRTVKNDSRVDSEEIELKPDVAFVLENEIFQAPEGYILLIWGDSSSRLNKFFVKEIQAAATEQRELNLDNVTVVQQRINDELYMVVVQDDGFGLPAGVIWKGIFINLFIIVLLGIVTIILSKITFPFLKDNELKHIRKNTNGKLKPGQFNLPKEESMEKSTTEGPTTEPVIEHNNIELEKPMDPAVKTEVAEFNLKDAESKVNAIVQVVEKELSKKPRNADALNFVLSKYKNTLISIQNGRLVNETIGCAKIYSEGCGDEKSALLAWLKETEEYLQRTSSKQEEAITDSVVESKTEEIQE